MYLFEGLRQQLAEYLPPDQVQRAAAAFKLAAEAHKTQKRRSGEPYITHPVAVAHRRRLVRVERQRKPQLY